MAEHFTAQLEIIGINPFVSVPEAILSAVLAAAGRDSGAIPVKGSLNGKAYVQTLVRYRGAWRLYVNTTMLKDSPRRIGELLELSIEHDPADRSIPMQPALGAALDLDAAAKAVFDALPPSRKKEINRYIAGLKSADAVARNVGRAIDFLHGRGRFVGRDRP